MHLGSQVSRWENRGEKRELITTSCPGRQSTLAAAVTAGCHSLVSCKYLFLLLFWWSFPNWPDMDHHPTNWTSKSICCCKLVLHSNSKISQKYQIWFTIYRFIYNQLLCVACIIVNLLLIAELIMRPKCSDKTKKQWSFLSTGSTSEASDSEDCLLSNYVIRVTCQAYTPYKLLHSNWMPQKVAPIKLGWLWNNGEQETEEDPITGWK